ncbi:MAG TPA: Rrf2 family transcriptional regulator [Candidatus Enterocloster excrementipullorum]|uniref:Rrf2 family transcriptional regulator n=1 Tax=Candidatus Enterocloster excrementipullorum TaxID=2838559 RepID=A0A9D2MXZ3_9FIRM|nr:Rrf2 family transcriptional regulator [Candidatus Enterocloster excrementipullorum]
MKFSTRLSDAVHILLFIYLNQETRLSSDQIAKSICTNPSYVRRLMAEMKEAGLIRSMRGQANPMLQRSPDSITLLDVYRAVEDQKPLLHLDTHTNPECGVGVNIQLALQEHYDRIQEIAEKAMGETSLQDILDTYYRRLS